MKKPKFFRRRRNKARTEGEPSAVSLETAPREVTPTVQTKVPSKENLAVSLEDLAAATTSPPRLPEVVALLILDPKQCKFEVKDLSILQSAKLGCDGMMVADLLSQIPSSFVNRELSCQVYQGLVTSQGTFGASNVKLSEILTTSEYQILAALPLHLSVETCHSLAREILTDENVQGMLQETKGCDLTSWKEAPVLQTLKEDTFTEELEAREYKVSNQDDKPNPPAKDSTLAQGKLPSSQKTAQIEAEATPTGEEIIIASVVDNATRKHDVEEFPFKHIALNSDAEEAPVEHSQTDNPVEGSESMNDRVSSSEQPAANNNSDQVSIDNTEIENHVERPKRPEGEGDHKYQSDRSIATDAEEVLNEGPQTNEETFNNEHDDDPGEDEDDVLPRSCCSRCCGRLWHTVTGRKMNESSLMAPLLQNTAAH